MHSRYHIKYLFSFEDVDYKNDVPFFIQNKENLISQIPKNTIKLMAIIEIINLSNSLQLGKPMMDMIISSSFALNYLDMLNINLFVDLLTTIL